MDERPTIRGVNLKGIKMTKSRQKTLFQTWSGPKRTDNNSARVPLQNYQEKSDAIQISDDEQDDDLLKALELSLLEAQPAKDGEPTESSSSHARCSTLFSSVGENDHNKRAPEVSEDRKCTMFPRERKNNSNNNGATTRKPSDLGLFKVVRNKQESLVKYIEDNPSKSASNSEEPRVLSEAELLALEDLPGFDKFSGQRWIYPTNYPVRDYQYNIVKSSLYENTLVVLPTGLGKTFVAAVVMYNFYRWYPQGKVIFMAPTKPLVAQQIEACYNVMGIPQDVTAEMTGNFALLKLYTCNLGTGPNWRNKIATKVIGFFKIRYVYRVQANYYMSALATFMTSKSYLSNLIMLIQGVYLLKYTFSSLFHVIWLIIHF